MQENFTCKNCGNSFTGKFCNNCGEKVYTDKDRSVKHLLFEGFHFLTHFDGTLLTTIKTIFTRPGKLSLDYCNGLRKRYFKPLSFFLLLVILYLLFPVFEGLNMKLHFHLRHDVYGKYAMAKVVNLINERNITFEQFSESFQHAGEKTSKFLLFIIIPAMAFISRGLGFRKRKYYVDHFVFTTETSSFFILWGFLFLPLLLALYKLMTGTYLMTSDRGSGIVIISVFMIYLAIAAKRFFNFKWWYTIVYTILFTLSFVAFIEYIYKFILFFIAFHLAK